MEPDGIGGMVSLGVLPTYRFGYPQNENFHAIRQGQSVPAPASKRTCKGLPRMLDALIAYGGWQNGVFPLKSCQAWVAWNSSDPM